MKRFIKQNFPGVVTWLNKTYNYLYHLQFYKKSKEEVFYTIYKKNHWANAESISGPGSSIKNTESIRERIPQLIKHYNIQTVLDIPCGDFNWMKTVDLSMVQYTGMDIVNDLVAKNAANYSNEKRSFMFADITSTPLPTSDLVICRDCLVHLSFDDIQLAIENLKRSNSKYLLTTTFPDHTNFNIITGNWRPVNLCEKPFSFGPPLELISENEIGEVSDKALGLWKINALK